MQKLDSAYIHQGLNHLLAAGRSLILVETFEEDRLGRLLGDLAHAASKDFWTWDLNRGLVHDGMAEPETQEPERALAHLLAVDATPIVWFKDLHHHYRPVVVRALRDLYYAWRDHGGCAIVSATGQEIPGDLQREMAYLRLEMPGQRELSDEVERWQAEAKQELPVATEVISATLKGLTLSEARHGLNRLRNQKLEEHQVLRVLQEEKRRLVASTGTLEYVPQVPRIEELGGLENLKEWLTKRRDLLVSGRDIDRDIVPKGVLLMGVSGCGKSLCIKAVSSAWRLPLYRLEMVRVFSGAYGSPETAFANACHLMEEMAPAVLWIDEIEMGLSSGGSEGGNSALSRIFSFFLTWMQEKPPGLFVAATANRIDLLPAEMIRKGRFDQVFFVDLPRASEREAIFRIHLAKRGEDPDQFTPDVFADATKGWSGAEIEQCIIAAVTAARMEGRALNLKDLYTSRKQIVPLSTTMQEQVRHIRNWAYERAVRASAEE